VLDYEITNGNAVLRDEIPTEGECVYAVILSGPLRITLCPENEQLPAVVDYWERDNPNRIIDGGYFCSVHRHAIVGPLHD
jgi:hypothetical protein